MARKKNSQTTTIIAVIAIVAIGLFIARAVNGNDVPSHTPAKVSAPAGPALVDKSAAKGPADAPIVIYEVSEFQCPFCSRVTPTVKQVMETWPNDVRVVFKHNPLAFHADAPRAAIASMAADRQGKFWEMHDILFANQKALSEDGIQTYAKDIGLDMVKFNADIKDPAVAARVDADQAQSIALKATGTPAFFINGVKISGAQPFTAFKTEIDAQLVKVAALEAEGVARGDIARRISTESGATATDFIKYFVDDSAAPPVPKKAPAKKKAAKKEDNSTVWKVPVDVAIDQIKGPKHALVTIVEFSEFQCPFCSKVLPTHKRIVDTYGDKVRIIFKHNPLAFHADAPLASAASLEAAAQGKFWEMHDLLFEKQKALKRADLEGYATELGLDIEQFKTALEDGRHDARIANDMALAESVQAKGTPNAFVNGRQMTGAKPFDAFKVVIDEEIAKAQKLVDGGVAIEDIYSRLIKGGKVFSPLQAEVKPVRIGSAATKGQAGAPIEIVEWSDFQCPYCSRVGGPLQQLVSKYPGQVVVAFKHFPLGFHKQAQVASEASLSAHAQGRFWDMHDIMFSNQKALTRDRLELYAQQLGLDMDAFKRDLDKKTYAQAVKADMAEGQRAGVKGTPSVFINGRRYQPAGGYSLAGLEKILAAEAGLKVKE